jgi:hypothetical protein
MSRPQVYNPGPLRQGDALREEEELMLDALEASTGRLYQASSHLHDEANYHNKLLKGNHIFPPSPFLSSRFNIFENLLQDMDKDAEDTADSLHAEARNVDRVKSTKKGVCWMYICITVEASLLLFLIYVGLS